MKNTDRFLSKIKACPEIDEVFILSADTQIQKLAEKHHINVLRVDVPFSIEGPYTFAETTFWAREFHRLCPCKMEEMVIIDHRNLDFTINTLKKVLFTYNRNKEKGVISVALCQDHPCQFRSYTSFLGCDIFYFREAEQQEAQRSMLNQTLCRIVQSSRSDWGEITLRVHLGNSKMGIRIDCPKKPAKDTIIHVLPFSDDGPLYERFVSVSAVCTGDETMIECDRSCFSGVIVTLFTDDFSGCYDSVEHFTPKNADWEIGAAVNVIVDKKTHIPIQGRQQFTPVYSFDGAIYVSHRKVFSRKRKINPVPVILDRSSIVTDLVEYYRFACLSMEN